jgi:hypothetical protein
LLIFSGLLQYFCRRMKSIYTGSTDKIVFYKDGMEAYMQLYGMQRVSRICVDGFV